MLRGDKIMYSQKILNQIKIKGTPLDRRIKLTECDRKLIKELREEGLSLRGIASIVNLSYDTVRRSLMTEEQLTLLNIYKNNIAKRCRAKYLDSYRKRERKSRKDCYLYKSQLLDTKFKNIGA